MAELAALSADPRFAAELERQKLLALKELAYGASHEINNPLANVAARAQALLAGETDPDRRQSLAVIAAQAFRAHEMIADLMLFAHPPAPVKSRLAAEELAAEVVRQCATGAAQQATALHLPPTRGELPALHADRTQLAAALRALVRNALEALGQGGTVTVQLEHTQRCSSSSAEVASAIAFHVCDNGPGVPEALRARIFDPYFSGREAGRGHGLGLSKAWRIAQLHGGDLVAQTPATGAHFTLWLPAEEAVREDAAETPADVPGDRPG